MKLFYNTYTSENSERNNELRFCYLKNKQLLGKDLFEYTFRLTYKEAFSLIIDNAQENEVCVFCNSDIFFDKSIFLLDEINRNEFMAITRHEYKPNGEIKLHHNPTGSQDVWAFRNTEHNRKRISEMWLDFKFGVPGCDNRVSYEFYNKSFNISNPHDIIKCYHYHESGIRSYNPERKTEIVPPPYYTDKLYMY